MRPGSGRRSFRWVSPGCPVSTSMIPTAPSSSNATSQPIRPSCAGGRAVRQRVTARRKTGKFRAPSNRKPVSGWVSSGASRCRSPRVRVSWRRSTGARSGRSRPAWPRPTRRYEPRNYVRPDSCRLLSAKWAMSVEQLSSKTRLAGRRIAPRGTTSASMRLRRTSPADTTADAAPRRRIHLDADPVTAPNNTTSSASGSRSVRPLAADELRPRRLRRRAAVRTRGSCSSRRLPDFL